MTASATPISPRKQPRQARSTATVEAILEAAARILESAGLAAFNTNAVAEKAGVSVGSLYQYFPAKSALLAALIRRERDSLMAAIAHEEALATSSDLKAVLHGYIRAAVRHQLARPRLASSLEYAEAMLPLDTETAAMRDSIADSIAKVLQRHGIAGAPTVAGDLAALSRGMIDAAGLNGETDMTALEKRVRRAVYGYLGVS